MTPPTDESINVLHVDDDPEFGELVTEFLKREDDRFEMYTVTDPEKGLAVLEKSEIDCVVSDYEMADWNGLKFFRAVRATHPILPFIFFTSRRSEKVSRTVLSGEATQYLQKGCDVEQYAVLANRISDAVDRYRPDSERHRYPGGFEAAEDGVGHLDGGAEERHPLVEDGGA